MTSVVNLNGTITPADQARISVFDRGFLYGDSVYEVIRTYSGKPFAIERHLDRLERSAGRLSIPLPTREEMLQQLRRTLDAAENDESYCRIIVTRGSGPLTLDPTTAENPATLIFVKKYEPFPSWMYEKGVRLAIPTVRRTSREALDPAIKSGNYLNSVLAFGEARKTGFDDALLLDKNGHITESTSSNVFIVQNGTLVTPPLETGLLAGVTRELVINLAGKNGIGCSEQQLMTEDVIRADEVMLTSTLREVMPVVQVSEYPIADGRPGPVTQRMGRVFHAYARGLSA